MLNRYVLITPVKDEEENIQNPHSINEQSVRPLLWVKVKMLMNGYPISIESRNIAKDVQGFIVERY